MTHRVGVDVGGTFTDVVAVGAEGVAVEKVPSTPAAPDEAVTRGVVAACDPADLSRFAHGTTHATNAVLEGEWADTALLTTEGFRDVLEIGRQTRPDLYDLHAEAREPVVPRDRRYEVPERLDERGAVLESLDEASVREVGAELAGDVESVAVCLLYAFEDAGHEERVRELLREAGVEAPVTLSSEANPEIREYERTQTTALDAALRPVMARYLGRVESWLADAGADVPVTVMASNGGLLTADAAGERPVQTLLSGPAAGVRGAAHVAARRGAADVLTMDMGGTSCDVSLVEGGEPRVTTEAAVGDYPLGVPAEDVLTVGAGGGSVARVAAGGALRGGPESAGADPGPVCYGRGGERPTTTDAHTVLGHIRPAAMLDDPADDAAVRGALAALGDEIGTGPEAAARGVLDVATANLERALRVVSVERGHDPREFALVAFGGAGPLHAPRLAERLDVPRVLVPRHAGVLSAVGLLVSDVRYDHAVSRVRPLADADPEAVEDAFADLEARGRADLADADVPAERRSFERRADLRYEGQSHSLTVAVPDAVDGATLDRIAERFHAAHERRYEYAAPDEPVVFVTLRVRARGAVDPPDLVPADPGGTVADARRGTRTVDFGEEGRETPVYDRARLPFGAAFDGPAVVEGSESTCLVRPGQSVRVADDATLVVEVAG